MRIAFIQEHLRNGGTENQTLHIAHGLAKAGIDTHVIVFRLGGVLDRKADSSDFHLHFLNQGPLKTDWFAPGLKSLLDSLDIDVLIAMGRMANCQAGLLCSARRNFKIISTFRTGKTIPWLQRRALKRSDHLVSNSHEALRRIKELYAIDRPESTVIYNGCIRSSLQGGGGSPSRPKNEPTPLRLVSASMFRPEKKQSRLIRICAQLPNTIDWRLTLAGDGPERDSCIAEAQHLNIADRVTFPGLLANPTELYQNSDIAIHASSKESVPNFLVEAQMAGLPVIAYDVGGVCETFLPDESGFLVEHANEDAFVERLKTLAESPDLRLRMSDAGRDYAQRNFTPKAQLQRYIELLNKLNTR